MSNPLRQAWNNVSDDGTALSKLLRGSLAAAESKFYLQREVSLDVEILGREVEAFLAAQVSAAVVDSIAYFAKATEDSGATNVHMTNQFRQKLGIRTLAASGNHLKYGFTPPVDDPQTPLIEESESPSLAEVSSRNLALALPENYLDDQAVENAQGLLPSERTGLYRLSRELAKFHHDIRVELLSGHDSFGGVLTSIQAKSLEESLGTSEEVVTTERKVGRLDGMRTRRRQFFLDLDSGKSISGSVEPELLSKLPSFIDKRVEAVLVARRPFYANGREGRPVYRLKSISEVNPPETL